MEITEEEIIDILFNGSKEEIDILISRYDIGFDFSNEYNQYTIVVKSISPQMIIRGVLTLQIPNCTKYYGHKFNM